MPPCCTGGEKGGGVLVPMLFFTVGGRKKKKRATTSTGRQRTREPTTSRLGPWTMKEDEGKRKRGRSLKAPATKTSPYTILCLHSSRRRGIGKRGGKPDGSTYPLQHDLHLLLFFTETLKEKEKEKKKKKKKKEGMGAQIRRDIGVGKELRVTTVFLI